MVSCCPSDFAASATSCICSCPCGLFWFASRPITSASGTSWRSMPNRLALLSQRFCGVCHVLHLLLPLRAVLVCKQADHVGIRDELTQHAQPLGSQPC